MPLGKIQSRVVAELVKLGLLTPAQEAALAARPESLSGAALDCLIEAEFNVDPVQGRVAWARAVGISFCDITRVRVTMSTFELIPEEFCRENFLLPVGQVGKTLLVALANPFEVTLLDKLEAMTGRRVVRLLAHEKDLRHVFARIQASRSGHAADAPAQSWAGVTLPQLDAAQLADLAERANRTLAAELAARKWARADDIAVALRIWEERRAGGLSQKNSLLGILAQELKGLDENALLLQQMETEGFGLIDLGACVVPAEILSQLDLEVCRATWSVPFSRVGKFTLMASAYPLSSAVREFWAEHLGGLVFWYGCTQAGMTGFLAQCATARSARPARPARPVGPPALFVTPSIRESSAAASATDWAHGLDHLDHAVMRINIGDKTHRQ